MKNVYTFADRDTIEAEAREWLIKLDGEEKPSQQDREALQEWVARSPAHREELHRISAFWNDANILTELAIPLPNAGRVSTRHHLDAQTPTQHHPGLFTRLLTGLLAFKRPGAAMAVCLLGVAVALTTWLLPPSQTKTNGIYATAIGEVQTQTLADGSVIHINTDSQVQVDYSDTVRKIRLLRGEALFEVTKNPHRPFEVYAGDGMVKAVGTAFSVRLNRDDIKVVVSEGRVDLATLVEDAQPREQPPATGKQPPQPKAPPQSRLTKIGSLDRGQSATFRQRTVASAQPGPEPDTASLDIQAVPEQELSRRLSWREGYLVFAGDSLADVIDEVNRYTPVEIEIADPALRNLKIGGRFKVGEVEALYDVLEASFGIQVSRLDDQHIQLRPRG